LTVLTGDVRTTAESIVAKYPNSRSAVLPLLFLVQSVEGHVTEDGMREVAEMLGLTPAQILASGSFYTMLKKRPTGDYLVSVCRNISCTHRGARAVVQALEDHLGVEAAGQTTEDGRFTLETAECLATCDGAPSMQINYEDFYDMTPEKAVGLVEQIAGGQDVKSSRGEVVKTHREISREVAAAGVRKGKSETEMEHLRTVSGEAPPADMAPGFRPKESGHQDGHGG
jgi:NADH-quinone oxidoreductase subunit E